MDWGKGGTAPDYFPFLRVARKSEKGGRLPRNGGTAPDFLLENRELSLFFARRVARKSRYNSLFSPGENRGSPRFFLRIDGAGRHWDRWARIMGTGLNLSHYQNTSDFLDDAD